MTYAPGLPPLHAPKPVVRAAAREGASGAPRTHGGQPHPCAARRRVGACGAVPRSTHQDHAAGAESQQVTVQLLGRRSATGSTKPD
eukprot:357293-Chlamydomonas_euryale.AAC.8